MKARVGSVALIKNKDDKYLICKMPKDRGVYPGQWGIPGGGVEDGETMYEALEREVMEEVGLKVRNVRPFMFSDDARVKLKPGKEPEEVYMIHLVFLCNAKTEKVVINEEFEEYAWVEVEEGLREYDLNEATRETFGRMNQQ